MRVKKTPTFLFEKHFWSQKLSVVGVDEVGRGCLAGPVVAGAVRFDSKHRRITGITDSKQLSAKQRLAFAEQIKLNCLEFGIGTASVTEINQLGIVSATFLAMERALLQFSKVEVVIVDGNLKPHFPQIKTVDIQTIVKGDQLSYSIAAASIIAKVFRDELMNELDRKFSAFQWKSNKGYGTLVHRKALFQFGMTKHHRTKFCETALRKEVADKKNYSR